MDVFQTNMKRKTLNFYKLSKKVETVEQQITFLQKHKLLPEVQECPKCDKSIKYLGGNSIYIQNTNQFDIIILNRNP